jgi:hypothetical protein
MSRGSLSRGDFVKVMEGGFGDHTCRIAQAMAWFDGALYVGTGGRSLNPLGLSDSALDKLGPLARLALAKEEATVPAGATIWKLTPEDGRWSQVFAAPTMAHRGRQVPRDRNVRATLVMDEPDGGQALYFGVSAMKGRVRLIRTRDGQAFEEGPVSGLGLPEGADVPSIRCLVRAGGWVFSSPVGMIEGRGMLDDNMSAFPMVFRARHPFDPVWEPVSAPGFGNPDNLSVNEIAAHEGWLYAGTLNIATGAELWRCPLDDLRPEAWQMVFRHGAGLGPMASIISVMTPFGGAIYVATGLQRQGKSGIDRYGPVGGEVLRVRPDGGWDLVCGQNRVTEWGWKPPVSGLSFSFGMPLARGVWHMAEFDGRLYAGGADWRMFKTYLPPETSRLPAHALEEMHRRHDAYHGGFPVWSSADGVAWDVVTPDGFDDNPETGGARFLQPSPLGLYLGTSSTGRTADFGGVQVWLGNGGAHG